MQQSEEKAVCNDAVAPAAQCQQTFADDDDNTNSFDAFAFFLCLVKMSVYFHCQSVDQGGNLLGALTSAPTAASKKKRIENVLLLFFLILSSSFVFMRSKAHGSRLWNAWIFIVSCHLWLYFASWFLCIVSHIDNTWQWFSVALFGRDIWCTIYNELGAARTQRSVWI